MVEILLETNQCLLEEKCDCCGDYTLVIACKGEHYPNMVDQNHKIIKILLEKKAIVSQCDDSGRSLLYLACERSDEYLVSLLKSYGIVFPDDSTERSALLKLTKNGILNH